MAKNWMAYEAAEVLMGNNVEEIAEVGSRYPLFAKEVCVGASSQESIMNILKALPKVTARVVETGLKDMDADTEVKEEEQEEVKETNKTKKTAKGSKAKKEKEPEEEEDITDDIEEDDYESMTSKDLYKLCCERGISSKCKDRKKSTLIELLKANDGGESDVEEEEDWDEEEEEKDPYVGKSARELYKMCVDRGIKAKTKQTADAYVKLLKKADEKETEVEEEDDDDDWEI